MQNRAAQCHLIIIVYYVAFCIWLIHYDCSVKSNFAEYCFFTAKQQEFYVGIFGGKGICSGT